jgi:hypothetical protein
MDDEIHMVELAGLWEVGAENELASEVEED